MLIRRRELNAYKTQSRQANILMDLAIYLVRENRPVKIAHGVEKTGQEYRQSTMGKCAWGSMGKYGQW